MSVLERNLHRLLALPQEVWGAMDLATGILRVNVNSSDIDLKQWPHNVLSYNGLFETLVHEMFHAFQITLCGGLYFRIHNYCKDIFKFNKPLTVEELFIQDLDDSRHAQILDHLKCFSITNNHDIDLNRLIESSAFIAQKAILKEEYNIDSAFETDDNVYSLPTSWRGHPVKAFVSLVLFSFCTRQPLVTYQELSSLYLQSEKSLEEIIVSEMVKERPQGHPQHFIGFAFHISSRYGALPFYVNSINYWTQKLKSTPSTLWVDFFCDPLRYFVSFFQDQMRPTIFASSEDDDSFLHIDPPGYWNHIADSAQGELRTAILLSAFSNLVLKKSNFNFHLLPLKNCSSSTIVSKGTQRGLP